MKRIFLLGVILGLVLWAEADANASVTVQVNGTNYTIPQTNEKGWGTNVTNWIQAISANTLQPNGGTFTLTSDLDFGSNFGLKSLYYKSHSSNIAGSGVLRLSNTDSIGFRNSGNSADILLTPGASNGLLDYNGVDLVGISLTQTLTNKTISGSSNTITNIPLSSAVTGILPLVNGGSGSSLSATGGTSQVLKQISTGANITVGQLACSDLSNSVASCSTDATNADNIGSGTLLVARGGSGRNTLTNHGVLVGAGTTAITQLSAAAAGTFLTGQGASADPSFSATPTLGVAGTTLGSLSLAGNTSGAITIKPQAAAGTYNFNLPITAGSAGNVLTSQGGGTTAMTWTAPLTNPMTQVGDLIVGGSAGAANALAAGTAGQIFQTNGTSGAPAWTNASPDSYFNVGWATSVASNILTIALKQADGSTDPSTGGAAVSSYFRSPISTNGGYSIVSQTSALSLNITQGTTLGLVNSTAKPIWFYLINNSGAIKIGASTVQLDETQLQTTVAESFSATATNASPAVFTATGHGLINNNAIRLTGTPPTGFSTGTTYYLVNKATNTFQLSATPGGTAINSSSTGTSIVVHVADWALVSDAVYSSVPIRLLGQGIFSESTTGSWASNATVVSAGKQPLESISMSTWASANKAATTSAPFVFDSVEFDSHGIYGTGTGKAIAPLGGAYELSGYIGNMSTGSAIQTLLVYKNAAAYKNVGIVSSASGSNIMGGPSGVIRLNAFDTIELRPSASTTITGGTLATSGTGTWSLIRIGN